MFNNILYKETQYQNASDILITGGLAGLEKALDPWECACLGPLASCPCTLTMQARQELRNEVVRNIPENYASYSFNEHKANRPTYIDEDIWNRVFVLPIEEGREDELMEEVARLIMMERRGL